MRLSREFVNNLAKEITLELVAGDQIETGEVKKLHDRLCTVISDELTVEDRINEEVRELLRKFESEIQAGRMDYRKLFDMTKRRLITERGVIV